MRQDVLLGVSFATIMVAVACSSVRGAGLGDLVGDVPPAPQPDAAAAASEGAGEVPPRLPTPKCDPDPNPEPSKTVTIPAGSFSMGCNTGVDNECRPDELPTHTVNLDAFDVDVTEVTQAQYYECVQAGVCLAPTCDWDPCALRKNHPVVCIDRDDAVTYCRWQNKRLPTEAEWEKAARGTDGRKYPWGNDPIDCTRSNMDGCNGSDGKPGTLEVGTLPKGLSPYGALDMAGNAGEWTTDIYDPNYYASSPDTNPKGPDPSPEHGWYVGRGGGWRSTAVWHRTSQRDNYESTYVKDTMGLRCVR
jgi:formylglycine-generating enzyme required for sulfatase activity